MAVGKLSILAAISTASAQDMNTPRFFEYRGGSFTNQLVDVSFGWFRTLKGEQKDAYMQSITHAVMFAETGQAVQWYKGDASGVAVPVVTWPTGSGYCRRIHTQIVAYNIVKDLSQTACFSNASRNWRWVRE